MSVGDDGGSDAPTPRPAGHGSLGDELRGASVERLLPVDRAMYAMLGEFARGGLGRIFRARDQRTGRIVAIKEVQWADHDMLARFAREALVTANLQHPSIVPVYEVGRWDEAGPFFAMKLVQGRTLEDLVALSATTAERLALLPHAINVADALAYAHGERVIHRDLKPANVLVGSYGETVVIDWGLARNLSTGEEGAPLAPPRVYRAGETEVGSVMGTPAYMPPEQARGEALDERADVYAIGAILYQVLGGRRPYAELRSAEEVLRRVTEAPPAALSLLAPELPVELIAIVDRAMAPVAADRYPTAQGLAEDLRRFQAGQLVRAHHYTPWELGLRWVRRHRALVVTALASLTALGMFGVYSVRRIAAERDEATRQRGIAVRARALAERRLGDGLEELGRQALVSGDAARALPLLAGSWTGRAEGPPTLRFLTARALDAYGGLLGVAPAQRGGVLWAALTPDGALLVSAGFGNSLQAWDVAAHRPRWTREGALLGRLSPDGRRVVGVGAGGAVAVYATADGAPLARLSLGSNEPSQTADWSSDGTHFAVGDRGGTLGLWRASPPWTAALRPDAHAGQIRDLRFSPDGRRLATTGDDGRVLVWDVATMAAPTALVAHQGHVNSLAWASAATLVSGGDDGAVIAWDLATARPLRTLAGGAEVYRVAVDPSGSLVAAAVVDPAVPVWNLRTGERIASLGGHHGSANDAVFAGTQLVTADEAGVLRTWDAARGELDLVLPADRTIFSVTARDRWLVLAGEASTVRLVSTASTHTLRRLIGHRARVRGVAFAPDGGTLYTASNDGTARAWNLASAATRFAVGAPDPQPEAPAAPGTTIPPPNAHGVRAVTLSPDGRTLATAAEDGAVALWSAATGVALGTLDGHRGRVRDVSFTRDGATAFTHGLDGTARLWDLPSRRERARIATGSPILAARFHESSRRVSVLGEDATVSVWDAASGARVDDRSLPSSRLADLPLTPRGEVVGAQPVGVFLVDPATARVTREFAVSMVASADVSADGATLALGAAGGDVSFVDLASGLVTHAWHAFDGVVAVIRLRPDGRLVATIGLDGVARVWEPASGRLLAAAPPFPDVPTGLRWSPDGRLLVVSGMATQAWVWSVAPYEGDAAGVARRARCVSPWRLDGTAASPATPDPAACAAPRSGYGVLTGSGSP